LLFQRKAKEQIRKESKIAKGISFLGFFVSSDAIAIV